MNIVILTILLPYPLTSGGAQAQYNIIDQLRHRHDISIVFLENPDNHISAMHELQRRWPNVHFYPYRYWRQLTSPAFVCSKLKRALQLRFCADDRAFIVRRFLQPYGYPMHWDFQHFFNRVVRERKADIVQIEFYPYLSYVHKLPAGVKRVFVHHELRYVRNQCLLAPYELTAEEKRYQQLMFEREIADLNEYDQVVTLTDTDAAELKAKGVRVPIAVSPAAVNATLQDYRGWNGSITFLGGYGHTPNQEGMDWFLQRVVPQVDWSRYPEAKIKIIGKGWPADYGKEVRGVSVSCCGFVEDLASAVAGSVMVVPILSGSGMRMKILEAAAMGIPMLTTSVGVEGLDFRPNEACLLANSPEAFAQALQNLMQDDGLRVRLTDAAHRVYEQYYSVAALARRRNQIYEN